MNVNARFDQKFLDELRKLESAYEFLDIYEVYTELFSREDFNQQDFFDLLDYSIGLKLTHYDRMGGNEKAVLLSDILASSILTEYYENWSHETIAKYKKFILDKQVVLALHEAPKPLFDYYTKDLNWHMLLINTFIVEEDKFNLHDLEIVEEFKDVLFEKSMNHPASASMFFYLYLKGVHFDFDYLKNSLIYDLTTFSEYMIKTNLIKKYYQARLETSTFAYSVHEIEDDNNQIMSFEFPLDPLLSKLVLDEDIRNHFELED